MTREDVEALSAALVIDEFKTKKAHAEYVAWTYRVLALRVDMPVSGVEFMTMLCQPGYIAGTRHEQHWDNEREAFAQGEVSV